MCRKKNQLSDFFSAMAFPYWSVSSYFLLTYFLAVETGRKTCKSKVMNAGSSSIQRNSRITLNEIVFFSDSKNVARLVFSLRPSYIPCTLRNSRALEGTKTKIVPRCRHTP